MSFSNVKKKGELREYSFWVRGVMGELIGDEYVIEAMSLSLAYREFFSQVIRCGCEFPSEIRIEVEEIRYEHIGECPDDCSCSHVDSEKNQGPEEDLEEVV
jgi:hypothetical protein